MDEKRHWHLRRIGILVGAWLVGFYALTAETVNRLALPEVPLAEPANGLFPYMLSYLAIGAFLGLVCCWPSSTLAGSAVGGAVGALGILAFNWIGAMDAPDWMGGMTIITFISFLPMALMLAPVAFLVRFAAESFIKEPTPESKTNILRFWRPVVVTVIFFFIGATSLYPQYIRDALQETYDNVTVGLTGDVQGMLEPVWKFPSGADGTFILEYTDSWQDYAGQYSASLDPLSAYLIRVRFTNGFDISCLYSSTSKPVCLNEDFPFGE